MIMQYSDSKGEHRIIRKEDRILSPISWVLILIESIYWKHLPHDKILFKSAKMPMSSIGLIKKEYFCKEHLIQNQINKANYYPFNGGICQEVKV